MKTANYVSELDKDRQYDRILPLIVNEIKQALSNNDDDFLVLISGLNSTGKSVLMLHLMKEYLDQEASIDYVGFNHESFAKAYDAVVNKDGLRFCAYDEANIDRRASMSQFNKDLVNLYLKNRALNIFHVWCNPSAQQIDGFFIKERIRGMFFTCSKDPKIRPYYYISRTRLLRLYEKYQSLDENVIRKVVKEYAVYKGWYRDYDGLLQKEYKTKKLNITKDVSKDFVNKWTNKEPDDNLLSTTQVRKKLAISIVTLNKYCKKYLIQDQDYIVNIVGHRKYYKKGVEKLIKIITDKRDSGKLYKGADNASNEQKGIN